MTSLPPLVSPLSQAREALAQRTLLLSTLLFPLAVLGAARHLPEHLATHHVVHLVVLAITMGMGWTRVSPRTKSLTVVLGLATSAFVAGLPTWGFAAGPMATAALLCIYATLLYGRGAGLFTSFLVILSVLGFGVLHVTGHLSVPDGSLAQNLTENWQNNGVAVASFLFLPVFPIVSFLDEIAVAARSRAAALDATIAEESKREDAVEAQRAAQLEVREAQRQRTLGRMAGGLAHEINGVLQEIEGWIEVLRREGDGLDDEHDEAVREMRDSVRRAAAVGRRLLYVGGQNLSTARPTDLAEFLERVHGTLTTAAGPSICVTVEHEPVPWVQVDTTELTHVLVNLVVNARDAMPGGGNVQLTLRPVPPPPGSTAQPHVRLSVQDSGPGIAPEVLPHVFEPFFTTKGRRGTGLGLAIVRRLIDGIGGTVDIESAANGTTLGLIFPGVTGERRNDGLTRSLSRVSPGPVSTGDLDQKPRLLFVEDQPSIRQVFSKVVPRSGIDIRAADSADAALGILETYRPDLIWSDAIMPGRPVQDLIARAQELDIPIVICSGHVEEELLRRDLRTRDVEFVPKPYTARQLIARTRQAAIDGAARSGPSRNLRVQVGAADRALQSAFAPLPQKPPPRLLRSSPSSVPAPSLSEPPTETARSPSDSGSTESAVVIKLTDSVPPRSLVVLLADDDPSVRRSLKRGLERVGMTVLEASNGKEAELLFLSHFEVDVVVLDANMPEQDGETTARLILQARPSARVVLCSGYGVSGLAQIQGVSAVLSKPIALPRLTATLHAVVERPPGQAQAR